MKKLSRITTESKRIKSVPQIQDKISLLVNNLKKQLYDEQLKNKHLDKELNYKNAEFDRLGKFIDSL